MEDIIDIIVTETTNTIEITSQGTDEIIDVNIIDNREDIVLNVTPTVVEININSLTSNFGITWGEITGTLSNQTDLNTALGLKADLVGGKVPSSQLPSYVDDVVEVANYAALPATGETGKIYITLDTNKIYRWSGSAYIEIADSTAVWGAITGTLSSQTDLQSALNAKFDDPTGDTTQYIAGDGSLITFPVAGQSGTLVREVRNTTGATLTKGTIVYISGATGNKPTVSKAIATGDSTSAQTFGMCQANISNNSNGYVVCVGDLGGLDTSALTEGAQLYLSSTTAGTYTTTKQLAPNHLVYIGVVTRAHPTQGQIEVKIQNGYELDEIHDVAISSLANNDGLFYESSTDLWKNKSIATVLGYTPANGANYLPLTGGTLSGQLNVDSALRIKSGSATGILLETYSTNELRVRVTPVSTTFDMNLVFPSASRTFTFPNATGTLALTSDLSAYALDSAVVHNTGAETISGIKYFFSGSKHDLLFVSETVGYASIAGYSHFKANTDHVEFINGTNTKATKFIHGNGNYAFTMPNASGTIALTSNLSSYLPLSGGTLTGALSGTSVALSGAITTNGTTLSSWGNVLVPALETLNGNSISSYNASNIPAFYFASNAYHNGTSYVRKTANSAVLLSIDGYNNNFQIQTASSSSAGSAISWTQRFNIDGSTGAATFSSSVTANSDFASILASDSATNLFRGTFVTGNGSAAAGKIRFGGGESGQLRAYMEAIQSWNGSYTDSILNFVTTRGGVGGDIRMTINGLGNVGIGTTSPLNATGYTSISLNNATNGGILDYQQNGTSVMRVGNNGTTVAFIETRTATPLTISTNDTERMRITSGGNVAIGTTTPFSGAKFQVRQATNINLAFQTGTAETSGIKLNAFNDAADTNIPMELNGSVMVLKTGETERMRIRAGGSVGINTTGQDSVKFQVKADSTGSTNYAILLQDSSSNDLLYVRADGLISTGLAGNSPYNLVRSGRVMMVDSSGLVGYQSSTRESKINISNLEDISFIYKLNPVSFNYRKSNDISNEFTNEYNEDLHYGLIADEVEKVNKELVFYNEKNGVKELAGVEYGKMTSVLIKAIQELKAELDTLKNK